MLESFKNGYVKRLASGIQKSMKSENGGQEVCTEAFWKVQQGTSKVCLWHLIDVGVVVEVQLSSPRSTFGVKVYLFNQEVSHERVSEKRYLLIGLRFENNDVMKVVNAAKSSALQHQNHFRTFLNRTKKH